MFKILKIFFVIISVYLFVFVNVIFAATSKSYAGFGGKIEKINSETQLENLRSLGYKCDTSASMLEIRSQKGPTKFLYYGKPVTKHEVAKNQRILGNYELSPKTVSCKKCEPVITQSAGDRGGVSESLVCDTKQINNLHQIILFGTSKI